MKPWKFSFNLDSSSSGPSLSLRDVHVVVSFHIFLRLLQPKAQHYVPTFPTFIIDVQQRYGESGHSNTVQIEFRGFHFLPHCNLWLLDSVLFFRSVLMTLDWINFTVDNYVELRKDLNFFNEILFLYSTGIVIFMSHLVNWEDNEFNCLLGRALCNMSTDCDNTVFTAPFMLPV